MVGDGWYCELNLDVQYIQARMVQISQGRLAICAYDFTLAGRRVLCRGISECWIRLEGRWSIALDGETLDGCSESCL